MYKIHYLLKCDYGINISCGRVYRLMKQMNLPAMSTRKPKFKGFSDQNEYDNHLQQNFNQNAPNTVWVSDITYIKAAGKFYYLCVIIDLFSRKVIAYSISGKQDSDLVKSVFLVAYKNRNSPKGLMFHSDRGSQYNSFSFRKLLDDMNVVQSFSKKGHPYDNAVAESFFKYLKLEETNRKIYSSIQELKLSVFEYIEGYYNSKRPHSSLGMLTPNQKEANFYRLEYSSL